VEEFSYREVAAVISGIAKKGFVAFGHRFEDVVRALQGIDVLDGGIHRGGLHLGLLKTATGKNLLTTIRCKCHVLRDFGFADYENSTFLYCFFIMPEHKYFWRFNKTTRTKTEEKATLIYLKNLNIYSIGAV
jgi:hypothetical protein